MQEKSSDHLDSFERNLDVTSLCVGVQFFCVVYSYERTEISSLRFKGIKELF